MKAPYFAFGETRLIPVNVYVNGHKVDGQEWEEALWVERAEDWYAFSSNRLKNKRVWVVDRADWLRSKVADE